MQSYILVKTLIIAHYNDIDVSAIYYSSIGYKSKSKVVIVADIFYMRLDLCKMVL